MKIEIVIGLISLLGIVIIYLASAYHDQKMINSFLNRKIKLVNELKMYETKLNQRQTYLNRYDFKLFNLNDALISQKYRDF